MDTTAEKSKGGSEEGPRVIKRYANRKLYDTRDSRYVTLQQIAEFVRHSEDVRIIDNNTKEDLTNVTLAQIIYEEEKKGETGATSIKNLRSLIQSGGERLMTSLRSGPLGKLVHHKDEEGEEGEGGTVEVSESETYGGLPLDDKRSVVGPAKEALDQLQKTADDRVRALVGTAMGHVQQLQAEVKRLQGRIEELEDRLMKATRRSGGKKDSEPPTPPEV